MPSIIDTTTTLEGLREEIRELTDYVGPDGNEGFLNNNWLDREIKRSALRLWDVLYHSWGPSFLTESTTVATVSGTREYELPSNMWRFTRADRDISGTRVPMKRISFASATLSDESSSWSNGVAEYYHRHFTSGGAGSDSYAATGVRSRIGFNPIPGAVYTVNINYIPTPPTFRVDGVDHLNLLGFEQYVILQVAMRVRQKDEGDIGALAQDFQDYRQSIIADAPPKDAGAPPTINDVRSYDDAEFDFFFRRRA